LTNLRSELVRIASSYSRLFLGFIIGIFMVRQLLSYGQDIFNIYTIITIGAGVGIMLKELMRIALVPHLSSSWNSEKRDRKPGFSAVYANAFIVSALAATLGLMLMMTLYIFLGKLSIEPENLNSAAIFLICRTVIMFFSVVCAPILAMISVTQRFKEANFFLFLERFLDFIAVLSPLIFLSNPAIDGGQALVIFGVCSLALSAMLYAATAWRVIRANAVLVPNFGDADTRQIRQILKSAGWAGILVISFNIYLRFDTFFINLEFGAVQTVAFGITAQLLGMVRQLTVGLVHGLDSVVAKLSFKGRQDSGGFDEQDVISFSSYAQTLVTANALLLLVFCSQSILQLWVGDRVSDDHIITLTAQLTTIMLVGIGLRSLSEGWMSALNGQNKVNLYTRYTLPIALLNPIILIGVASFAPSLLSISLVAFLYAGLLGFAHAVVVPIVYARASGTGLMALYRPILRAMLSPLIAILVLYFMHPWLDSLSNLLKICATLAIAAPIAAADLALYVARRRKRRAGV